jgi:hypothetical protein
MFTKKIFHKKKEIIKFISEYFKILMSINEKLGNIKKNYMSIINTFNSDKEKEKNKEIITHEFNSIFKMYQIFYVSFKESDFYLDDSNIQGNIIKTHHDSVSNCSIKFSIINYKNFIKKNCICLNIYLKTRTVFNTIKKYICIEYHYKNFKFYKEQFYDESDCGHTDSENIDIVLFDDFLKVSIPPALLSDSPMEINITIDDKDSFLIAKNPDISGQFFKMQLKNFYTYWGNEKESIKEIESNIADINNILSFLKYNFNVLV